MNTITRTYTNKNDKSFARRIGKKLSKSNQDLLNNILPNILFSPEKMNNTQFKKTFLEIGFGMGEHFLHQVASHNENLYIGAEVYLNGVANILKYTKNNNLLLWPDDIDLILDQIPQNSLDGIYVLFPDPWHKRRNLKRRLMNINRISKLKILLKKGGFVFFASDIEDYFNDVVKIIDHDSDWVIDNNDFSVAHEDYVTTKYHKKAIHEGRNIRFLNASLV